MAEGGTNPGMSETESVPRGNSLYSRHSRNYVESVSLEICSILTRLGYGEEFRRRRSEKYREMDRLINARQSDVTMITAGSKAEGLTCVFESDNDLLCVINTVLCVEAGINLHTITDDSDVFRMDTRVYPGHCRPILVRQAHARLDVIYNALCDNGYGNVLLSSSLLLDEMSRLFLGCQQYSCNWVHYERAGPSLPASFNGVLHMDHVFALRCHCPSTLERWAVRPRHWPSEVIVQKVVSLGAYLTPVGFKESEYKHNEWRICFNTGEAELVNNLNDTQAKVYVLLKMILNEVLRPCTKELTSYVMKNIVLWQAESNPQNKLYARSLFHWLHVGLRDLRTAIVTQQLAYYMIPERNLMAASGLQDKQQSKWVADITCMMAEGPRVILRLPKIRRAIICSPEPLLWFSRTRMELEMLRLEASNIIWRCRDKNGVLDESDASLQEIYRRQGSDTDGVALRMLIEGYAFNDPISIHNRILM